MKIKTLVFSFCICYCLHFLPLFIIRGTCQISLNSNYFPLAGTSYVRWVCSKGNVGVAGSSQIYNFSNAQAWSVDTLRYLNPSSTGYASYHPNATVAFAKYGTITQYWYFSSDSNAFWVSGGTLKGDFGNGYTSVHANHSPPYVDTLISNEYVYGHSETEISGLRYANLTPGVDFQAITGKYITVDGWGSLIAPMDTFPNVLRVKYIEYKFDTIFTYDTASQSYVAVDATLDTLYYYKFFTQGKRHPVVTTYTNEFDSILYSEIIQFPQVYPGCTDTSAENYNPMANSDDGSCIYCNQVNYSVTGDTSICKGDSLTLTASGATSYLWSTGDTVSSITVSPNSSGTFSVYLSNLSYCWEVANVNVSVAEEVQAGFWANFTNPSDTVQFVNTSLNATSFYWTFENTSTSTSQNPRHLFSGGGPRTVMLIASNACSADTLIMTLSPEAQQELASGNNGFDIYPNPADGKFLISSHNRIFEIRIYNNLGEMVYRNSPGKTNSVQQLSVDLGDQSPGLYIAVLQAEDNFFKQRLILK